MHIRNTIRIKVHQFHSGVFLAFKRDVHRRHERGGGSRGPAGSRIEVGATLRGRSIQMVVEHVRQAIAIDVGEGNTVLVAFIHKRERRSISRSGHPVGSRVKVGTARGTVVMNQIGEPVAIKIQESNAFVLAIGSSNFHRGRKRRLG